MTKFKLQLVTDSLKKKKKILFHWVMSCNWSVRLKSRWLCSCSFLFIFFSFLARFSIMLFCFFFFFVWRFLIFIFISQKVWTVLVNLQHGAFVHFCVDCSATGCFCYELLCMYGAFVFTYHGDCFVSLHFCHHLFLFNDFFFVCGYNQTEGITV